MSRPDPEVQQACGTTSSSAAEPRGNGQDSPKSVDDGSRATRGMGYAAFLRSKGHRAGDFGAAVDAADLHPNLHPWQRDQVAWAIGKGRAALWWDCGLGKTRSQVEWARHSAESSLIVAPLAVARQTVSEAREVDADVRYVRSGEEVSGPGIWITNYEMVEHFDPADFGAVVLDESSILKAVDGKTRRTLTERFAVVPRRLACSATPAPNDVAELANHAEFLGVMSRAEMLAAYFVNDDQGWRLKGHAAGAMFDWMSSWASALRRPSDVGGSDTGYVLPPLRIHDEVVDVEIEAPEGQFFATELGGVAGRAQVRRQTLAARVERAKELADQAGPVVVWCALNDEAEAIYDAIDHGSKVNVHGAMSPDDKAGALERFAAGDIRVLITKPSIAGFGMNFQHCARMVFVGLGDSYEAYYQAIRRCWRFGQSRAVDVHIVLSPLEQQIASNVRRKEQEATQWTARLVAAMKEGR